MTATASSPGAVSIDQLSEAFARDGFVNAGRVLDESELDELRDDVERFADMTMRKSRPAEGPLPFVDELGHDPATRHYRMIGICAASDAFARLIRNPKITAVASRLMGDADLVQYWGDALQYKPPAEGGPVNWHQDGPRHLGIGPARRIITAWVALDDADPESGCMWMVPGSHKWGGKIQYLSQFKNLREREEIGNILPPPGLDPDQWRAPEPQPVRAGEVHFHHAFTWHSSPINRSARLRRGYTMFLMPGGIEVTHPELMPRMQTVAPGTLLSELQDSLLPIVFRRNASVT